jgi:flagellar FliL protein
MAAAATADSAAPVKAGPSMIVQLGVLLVMTGAAIGIGYVSGGYLNPGGPPAAATAPASHAAPADGKATPEAGHGAGADAGHGAPADAHGEAAAASVSPEHPMIIPLAPITTNLAAPDQVWIRMEVSILLEAAPEQADLADVIHQDILAYVRTVKMHQVESASGFQHLKADLEDIASVRSQGKVKHVLIRTLLFE